MTPPNPLLGELSPITIIRKSQFYILYNEIKLRPTVKLDSMKIPHSGG